MLFVYPDKLDAARLRDALASVLDDFPQYAGRLVPHGVGLTIQHDTGAALFETERSDASLERLRADVSAGNTRRLEPGVSLLRIAAAREALLAVRLTEARDGCVLAVKWNHSVGDMQSTMLLMRAWADAYAGRAWPKPILLRDRDAYLRAVMPDPAAARSAAGRASWPTSIGLRLSVLRPTAHVSIAYSWTQLSALQQALSSTRRVSVNDAICAHVYAVLRRLSGAIDPTNLCLVVNYRKRLGLPEQLLGNMNSLLVQPVEELDSPAQIAAGIRQGLEEYSTRHADYHATMRVLDVHTRVTEWYRLISRQFRPGHGDILVTNWNKLGVYELAFGACRPVLFRPVARGATSLPQWVMIVYELPDARGLALTVGLPARVAERVASPAGQALLYRQVPRQASPRPVKQPANGFETAARG